MPLKIEGQGSGDRLLLSLEDPCVLPNRLIAIRQDGPRYKLFPTSFDSVHASDACLLFIKGYPCCFMLLSIESAVCGATPVYPNELLDQIQSVVTMNLLLINSTLRIAICDLPRSGTVRH